MSKTVRVRIAVAVGESGDWAASGSKALFGVDSVDIAVESLDESGQYAVSWVEADVPLPESETVEGKVTG